MASGYLSSPQRLRKAVWALALFGLGLFLLYLAFRRQDLPALAKVLGEANYWWAAAIGAISVLNHLSRAARWGLLLQPLGHKPPLMRCFEALMAGYLINYAVPRLGEFTRCAILQRRAGVPAVPAFGTVATERALDIACLALAIALALALEGDRFSAFFYGEVFAPLAGAFEQRAAALPWLLAGALLLAALLAALAWLFRKNATGMTLKARLAGFSFMIWTGIRTAMDLRGKALVLFLAHTLFIWATYLLMTTLWFYSFPETSGTGLSAGLAMMVVGSLGRSVPVQGGGLGAYHYLFAQGAAVFGIAATHGTALALIIHGFQTLFVLFVGGACLLWSSRPAFRHRQTD